MKNKINAKGSKAVKDAGGPAKVAKLLSEKRGEEISEYRVQKWQYNNGVPPEFVLDMEELTGISRHELRPDVFGETEAA